MSVGSRFSVARPPSPTDPDLDSDPGIREVEQDGDVLRITTGNLVYSYRENGRRGARIWLWRCPICRERFDLDDNRQGRARHFREDHDPSDLGRDPSELLIDGTARLSDEIASIVGPYLADLIDGGRK